MASKRQNLFSRLTSLFRSGPVVKRKITGIQGTESSRSTALDVFGRTASNIYSNSMNAYGSFDRLARLSDFCVVGKTKIATNETNGFSTIEEIVDRLKNGESVHTFSYDHDSNTVVLAPIKDAFETGVRQIWEIELDNGSVLKCTDNHPIMLRDGSYVRVDEAKEGMAVMPFYRKKFYGLEDAYRMIYSFSVGWRAEHVLVGEYKINYSKRLGKHSDYHVHHKNFEKENNNLDNLEVMLKEEHLALHARINNKRFEDPKQRLSQSKIMKSRWDEGGDLRQNQDIFTEKRKKSDGFKKGLIRLLDYNKTIKPGKNNVNREDQKKLQNANAYKEITIQTIYDTYLQGDTLGSISKKLNVSKEVIRNRLNWAGYKHYPDFVENYKNHKIVRITKTDNFEKVYDLTIDKYHNFAICDEKLKGMLFIHNSEMETMGEIATALNIYADETFAQDEKGFALHIYSENKKIQKILEELFYDTLNIEFSGRGWVRNLVKYGDFFLFNDISPQYGVINAFPVPVNEIVREEFFDPNNPFAVRFRWETQGNKILENWQITHFRLTGNDQYLPYGSSLLDPARRIFRQLVLMEDAMLVYRVVRSPERRVFYIDVGNTPPDDVPNVMEAARAQLKAQDVVDKTTGKTDLRYQSMPVDVDYWIAVRGSEVNTKIDTLPGGQNTTAIDDVEYLQKKLFAALGVPKPYLTYDENLGSKASLAQLDLRFARTILQIQKAIISEFNKIAAIHLAAHGYDGDDLLNFRLQLSNPSTIAEQQKLELMRTRFEIVSMRPEGMFSQRYLYKSTMGFTDDEIEEIQADQVSEAHFMSRLEDLGGGGAGGESGGTGGFGGAPGADLGDAGGFDLDEFGDESGGDVGGGDLGDEDLSDESGDLGGGEEGDEEEPEDIFAGAEDKNRPMLKDSEDETIELDLSEEETPVPQRSAVSTLKHNLKRRRHGKGASQNMMPKLGDMVSGKNSDFSDPYDKRHLSFMKDGFKENAMDKYIKKIEATESNRVRMDRDLKNRLESLKQKISINIKNNVLTEAVEEVLSVNLPSDEE